MCGYLIGNPTVPKTDLNVMKKSAEAKFVIYVAKYCMATGEVTSGGHKDKNMGTQENIDAVDRYVGDCMETSILGMGTPV